MQARGARASRFKARSLQQTLAVAERRAAYAPGPSLQPDAAEAAAVLPDESRVASSATLQPEAADTPLAAEAEVEKNFLKKSLQIVASVLPDAASTAAAGSVSGTGNGPVVQGKVVGVVHAKKAAHPSDTDASVPVGLQGASLLDQIGT